MVWQDIMIPIVRGLILDIDTPYKYSDVVLTRVILVATLNVSSALQLGYTINFTTSEISPDITTDYDSQNLICLKSACHLQVGDVAKSAEKGILIKDAIATIDTRNYPSSIIDILKSGKSYCDFYENSLKDYSVRSMHDSARAIVGPIRDWSSQSLQGRDR